MEDGGVTARPVMQPTAVTSPRVMQSERGYQPQRRESMQTTYTTVMTTNNGYDTILLVDENDRVISAWQADKQTVAEYAASAGKADEWHENEWSTFRDPAMSENEDELRTIGAYGEEIGRNGAMSDERREFWGL